MSCGVTVWSLRNFCITVFDQKFREINVFTKQLYCDLISRNIFLMIQKCFISLHCGPEKHHQAISKHSVKSTFPSSLLFDQNSISKAIFRQIG